MSRRFVFVAALAITSVFLLVSYLDRDERSSLSITYGRILSFSSGTSFVLRTFGAAPEVWVREHFAERARERAVLLSNLTAKKHDTLYNVLVPERQFHVFCPNLVRVGNVNDGGKFVCNPRAMPRNNCSIYSLGLRNEISFDQELQAFNNYSCPIYGYDANPSTENVTSEYKRINGKLMTLRIMPTSCPERNEYSLGDLVAKNNGSNTPVEILKMDIEGGEHQSLIPFLLKYKVCQILLEVHGDSVMHIRLLHRIAMQVVTFSIKLNYALFSYEVNGDSLRACEYSFIHLECMEKYGASILKLYLNGIGLP